MRADVQVRASSRSEATPSWIQTLSSSVERLSRRWGKSEHLDFPTFETAAHRLASCALGDAGSSPRCATSIRVGGAWTECLRPGQCAFRALERLMISPVYTLSAQHTLLADPNAEVSPLAREPTASRREWRRPFVGGTCGLAEGHEGGAAVPRAGATSHSCTALVRTPGVS